MNNVTGSDTKVNPFEISYGRRVMKIFIADSSVTIREGLQKLVSGIDGINVVGQSDSASAMLPLVAKSKPDIVIVDLELIGWSFNVLRELKDWNPQIQVMVLTNFPHPIYRQKCADAKVDFFFDKSVEIEKLLEELKVLVEQFSELPGTK